MFTYLKIEPIVDSKLLKIYQFRIKTSIYEPIVDSKLL